jgi:hypothetical protein
MVKLKFISFVVVVVVVVYQNRRIISVAKIYQLPANQILVQKKMLPVSLNIKVQINCPIF